MLVSNITEVPAMLALIVRSAFGLDQAAGGVTSQPRPCRCRPIPTGAVVRRVRRHAFGDRDPTFIAVVLFFIAGTSISGNDAKSESAVHYLRGGRVSILLLRLGSLAMVAGGAFARLDIVWDTADAAMGMMATVNLVAVAPLAKQA